ncbi:hypothetical protein [Micromonospora halophytica]|uniref:hypothetical protein n=1 Tax=Micromonospora halophytica TaxID=47864 RepID=UPI000B896539|nr:hypothetical protein [Micromonospora halophytica]
MTEALSAISVPTLAGQLAAAVAARAPVPPLTQLRAAARALRLLGVLTCMLRGAAAANCLCLMDLLKEVTGAEAGVLLDQEFQGLSRSLGRAA